MNVPEYLKIPAAELGKGQPVQVFIVEGAAQLGLDMAHAMAEALRQGKGATLIVPVGPADPFPLLATIINKERICCRDAVLINMDEYVTDDGGWIPMDHPLSFRGFMDRSFYNLLEPELAPPPENRVFPDPSNPAAVGALIEARGGVDACFGGLGINGHLAFNEPPEPGQAVSLEAFRALPTRIVELARETRTINAVTVGGEIAVVPRRAVTVGMKEILEARCLRLYANRPWQGGVVRRMLHGPITPECPASLARLHGDVTLTVTDYVAALPDIRIR